MTQSHDPIQRLVDADPARTFSGNYPDAGQAVRRALSSNTRPRIGTAFRAQVASAVLGASLLTGVGITALQSSAPSLPVLALSSSPSPSSASDSKMAGSMLRPMVLSDFRFDGSALAELPSSAPVWKITPPTGLTEFQQIAAALGLEGSVTTTFYENTPEAETADATYTITDPNRGTLTYSVWSGSGLGSWWFSLDSGMNGSATSSVSESAVSAHAENQYAEWATAFVASLGLDYEYSKPDVYLYDSPDLESSGASASFTMLLDGLATSIGLYVSFDNAGHITSASGALGHFERVGNYPLTGVADGVSRLQDQNSGNTQTANDTAEATDSGASSGAGDGAAVDGAAVDGAAVDFVAPSKPTVVNVALTSVTVQLQLASVGGDTYLVPYYVYGGSASSDGENAGSWDGTWTVIAVSSEYVTIDEPQVMPMAAR